MLWSPRTIGQAGHPLLPIPSPPFVTGLAANPEPLTQLTKIDSPLLSQSQKLLSQSHGRTLLPRHDIPPQKRSSCHCPMCNPCLWTPVTYVSGMYIFKEGSSFPGSPPCLGGVAAALG